MTRLSVILLAMIVTNKNKEVKDIQKKGESVGVLQISQDEARRIMDTEEDYVIVDVRTPEEYGMGHIKGAVNIPLESIVDQKPQQLPVLDQTILTYCHSGNRSQRASAKLAGIGYTKIYTFGGINTWTGNIVK